MKLNFSSVLSWLFSVVLVLVGFPVEEISSAPQEQSQPAPKLLESTNTTIVPTLAKIISPESRITKTTQTSTTSSALRTRTLPDYDRLPNAGDTFRKIRDTGKLFVDKTKHLEYILDGGSTYYFMTRPRMFGKSIFVDMMASFFAGERDRFVNLSIYYRGNSEIPSEWVTYPVIRFDFAELSTEFCSTISQFGRHFNNLLVAVAKTTFNLVYSRANFHFSTMIRDLRAKFKKPVIILIDEYDVLILSYLREGNKVSVENVKNFLNEFFAQIKARANDLKLVFVTGESKLRLSNVGFGVNVFKDITLDERFHDAVGISKEEINHEVFKPFINELGRCHDLWMDEIDCEQSLPKEKCLERVKTDRRILLTNLYEWYGGYSFTLKNVGTKMMNPYSVFNSFRECKLETHWICDQGLKDVVGKMIKYGIPWNYYENFMTTKKEMFTEVNYDMYKNTLPLPVEMFFKGVLTIESYDEITHRLIMSYPNKDIRYALKIQHEVISDKNYTVNYAKH